MTPAMRVVDPHAGEPAWHAGMSPTPGQLARWRAQLDCALAPVQSVFNDCVQEAAATLSPAGLQAWLEDARTLGKMGRGADPVLALLQEWPQAARHVGEAVLSDVMALLHGMHKSPNARAMALLLQSLPAVARALQGEDPMRLYLATVRDVMGRTTVSLHGQLATQASPGLPVLLEQAPRLLAQLTVAGLARWADYGVRHYQHHPQRQRDYFAQALPDSRAVLQRERHGTLLADVERPLELGLRALWQDAPTLHAYASGIDGTPTPPPWALPAGAHGSSAGSFCLPDVYDTLHGVGGLVRYRLAIAHLAGHRLWSSPLVADNLSPLQRLTVECLEDARIDHLVLRRYPGLRRQMLALHPQPRQDACDSSVSSCLRHRLVMLSRALLACGHAYTDPALLDCVVSFHALLERGESSTQAMQTLALGHAARTRRQSDQLAAVHFDNTVVSYRDDNRQLWRFIEAGDEEDSFTAPPRPAQDELAALPPRHYPEWDATSASYRPDWASVYEALHPSGDAGLIDAVLQHHAALARQLQQLLDRLQPQDRVRIRYQHEGSELDLDVAIQALVDWRAGAQPDPRILMSHRPNRRSIAVLVLLDLSQSLGDVVPGTGQTRLQLSQQAVALLGWAIDRLGDPFALAGFHSDTRHKVRYWHIKGFAERWDGAPKARLAALRAEGSTRMGAAMRHAAHYLGAQASDKKLLLVLTDGRPSDVDVQDDQALVADARQAVQELAQQGMHSHCISLDPLADTYVHDIFGHHASVVDRVEQLPERLTRLFLDLTR